MKTSSRAIWVFELLALFAGPACADPPSWAIERPPARLAADAFDTPYGRLMSAEAGKILRASADPECLRASNIDPATLEERGREMLVRNATAMLETAQRLVDGAKFEALVAARAGPQARSELAAFEDDPDVHRYRALALPARLAEIVDRTVENIERTTIIKRIALKTPLSPYSSANTELLVANPGSQSVAPSKRFLQTSDSPRLKRWTEIQDAINDALQKATDRTAGMQLTPDRWTPSAADDLAAMCVPPRR